MTIYELATLMHYRLCRDPHDADAFNCTFFRENMYSDKWNSTRYVHKKFLDKAQRVVDMTGLEIEDIAKVIREL